MVCPGCYKEDLLRQKRPVPEWLLPRVLEQRLLKIPGAEVPMDEKKELEGCFEKLCVLILYIALALPIMVWGGFVFCRLWGWFLTPAIHLAAPSIASCTGIVAIIRWLRPMRTQSTESLTWDCFRRNMGTAFFAPAFALLVGQAILDWVKI